MKGIFDLLTIGTWGYPSPLRHADILNVWSPWKNPLLQQACTVHCACCRIVNFFNNDSYQTLPKSHILKTSYIAEKGKTSMPNMRSAQARETVRKILKITFFFFIKQFPKKGAFFKFLDNEYLAGLK